MTPRNVSCRSCGAAHTIYPDFDRDADADLCGSCWLIVHSTSNLDRLLVEAQR